MNDPENPKNPFAVATREAALQEVEKSRAIAETQAALVIAKQFPRDQIKALDRILNACTRPKLAEAALYTYSRGGTEITGPSIRLAEVLAQNWQNIHWGTRELEQRPGESTMEAFAWDLETNGKQMKAFQVKHERHSKQGVTKLTDPRDIYETTANQGARRLRACILGVIPGDIIEEAVAQCELTLKSNSEVTPESLSKLLEVFEKYGVTKAQIEKRIQRHLDSMLPAQLAGLRKIFNSLKDGMSKPQDWFEDATEMPRFEKSEKKVEPETEKRKVGRPKKYQREDVIADLKAKLESFAISERQFCLGLLGLGIVQADFYEISELTDATLLQVDGMKFEALLENMETPSQSQLEVK